MKEQHGSEPARVPVTMKAFLSLISLFVVVQLIGTALFGLYLHMKLDKVGDELNLQEDVVFLRRLQKCRKSQDPDTTLLDCTKILKTFNDLQDVSKPFAMRGGCENAELGQLLLLCSTVDKNVLKHSLFFPPVLQWQKAIYAPMDDTFSYQDGNLKVTKSGRYFIYSQVAFCSNMLPHVPFSVYVYLNLPFQVDQLLLKGVGTHGTSGDLCGLQSIHLGRTAELQQGHTIFVNVTDSSRVNYNHENTYFGVFQLS
uniref:CD40 ligand n=1 Tax=Varanus komodoensis TaxID=61221 RepID=A0A8D2LG39_VARKO